LNYVVKTITLAYLKCGCKTVSCYLAGHPHSHAHVRSLDRVGIQSSCDAMSRSCRTANLSRRHCLDREILKKELMKFIASFFLKSILLNSHPKGIWLLYVLLFDKNVTSFISYLMKFPSLMSCYICFKLHKIKNFLGIFVFILKVEVEPAAEI